MCVLPAALLIIFRCVVQHFLQFYLSFVQFLLQFCVLVACGILFQGITGHMFSYGVKSSFAQELQRTGEGEKQRESV